MDRIVLSSKSARTQGIRFLCCLFSEAVSQEDLATRQYLRTCADKGNALSERTATDLAASWLEYIHRSVGKLPATRRAQALLNAMHGSAGDENRYCNLIPPEKNSDDRAWNDYHNICRAPLVDLLCLQSDGSREYLDFLALSFALSIGETNQKFSMEYDHIRQILLLCLQQLDMPIGFSLPEDLSVWCRENDGTCSELREYLAVCLAQALYVVFPPSTQDPLTSRERAQADLCDQYWLPEIGKHPNGLARELWERNQAIAALRDEWGEAYQRLRRCRIGRFDGNLEQVFELPLFGSVPEGYIKNQILYCDKQAILKQFLYGGQVGKSTLLQIVALCSAARHPFFSEHVPDPSGKLGALAQKLSMDTALYFPLLLDCEIADENSTDPLSEAVRQLCISLDAEKSLKNPRQQVLQCQLAQQLCEQQIRDKHLLLLIDNWDQAPAGIRNAVYNSGNEFHILVVSSQYRRSEIPKMRDFSFCKIHELKKESQKRLLDRFADKPEFYRDMLERKWYLKPFGETLSGMLLLLSQQGDTWDDMISREIDRQLERLEAPLYMSSRFFRKLAVSSLEGIWSDPARGATAADSHRAADVIPGNLMKNSLYYSGVFQNVDQAKQIWDQACSRRVLVCSADVPSGFQFKNTIFRYSLAADAYCDLLLEGSESAGNAVVRLCRLSPEDFSRVFVLMANRLCANQPVNSECDNGPVPEALHTLCRCIDMYVLSLTDVRGAENCCRALADILSGSCGRNLLSAATGEERLSGEHTLYKSRLILLRSYTYLYYATCCHNTTQSSLLPVPEHFFPDSGRKR